MREVPAQPVIPITKMMIPLAARPAVGALAQQRDQHDRQRQERDHQEPVVERRQALVQRSRPEARRRCPRTPPITADTSAAPKPTISEMRVPSTSSENMSRPFSSVPSGWNGCSEGGCQDAGRVGRCRRSGPPARSTARRSRPYEEEHQDAEADGAAAALADQPQRRGGCRPTSAPRGSSRGSRRRLRRLFGVAIATPSGRAGRGTRRPGRPARLAAITAAEVTRNTPCSSG